MSPTLTMEVCDWNKNGNIRRAIGRDGGDAAAVHRGD